MNEIQHKFQLKLTVAASEMLSERVAHIVLTDDKPLPAMRPGQFVQVAVPDGGVLLRRPISIHDVSEADNTLHLLVQTVGRGTHSIASVKQGDEMDLVLPLGNGFPDMTEGRVLLTGGGIGTAPLLYLGRRLKANGCEVTFLLGGRTAKDILRREEYEAVARVMTTTEDGSDGERGFVTDHSLLGREQFDAVMVCGPTPMMKAVARWASVPCYVSLENMMACGLGACLCCVQKNHEGHNVCVCTEGPVFNTNELEWK